MAPKKKIEHLIYILSKLINEIDKPEWLHLHAQYALVQSIEKQCFLHQYRIEQPQDCPEDVVPRSQ